MISPSLANTGDAIKIKGAIFDMDGTLVDSLMLWEVLWNAFSERFCDGKKFRPSAEDDKAVRTMLLRDAMQMIHEHYGFGRDGQELLDTANAIMADFYKNRVELKAGVRGFLEHLSAQGVKMCLASATAPDLVAFAVKHCELEKYFLKVFSCGELGLGKDKPDIYLLAKDFLETPLEETWIFEDSHVAIGTAASVGMPTVGIWDKHNTNQDDIKAIATHYIAEGETLLKLI